MKIAYVSSGNIPSRFAHSIQVLKNAQSWFRANADFRLFCNITPKSYLAFDAIEIKTFYGLQESFDIVPYPCFIRLHHWLLSRFTHPISDLIEDWYFRRVASRLAKEKVDLVFTRTNRLAKYTLAKGLPTLVETHSPPDGSQEKENLYALLSDDNFLGIVTITEQLDSLFKAHGLPEDKLFVAPDGVDLDSYASPLSKAEARAQLGFDPEQQYAVYVGHLYKDRGISEILFAAERLTETRFVIVGGHEQDINYWTEEIARRSIGNVDLVGFVENRQVPIYQWAADVLMMPYSSSCGTSQWMSPLKLFEYMAAGRAIISTRFEVFDDILHHGDNAVVVDSDDGEQFLAGLKSILSDQTYMDRLAEKSRADVQQRSWDQRVLSILEFAKSRME